MWVILYKLNLITVSPAVSLSIALPFTILFLNSIENIDIRYIFICVFWHILLLLLVKFDWSYPSILWNLGIFAVYLFFLDLSNTSFKEIYFTRINDYYHNRKFSLIKYVNSIINNM